METKGIRASLYGEVTQRIISSLEKGTIPWRKTWGKYGAPRNYATGHVYNGINAVLLSVADYETPLFMGFAQIKKLGGYVRRGEKAWLVVYYSPILKERNSESEEEAQPHKWVLKSHQVFNIAQVEGIEFNVPELEVNRPKTITFCEEVVATMPQPPKLKSVKGGQPLYYPRSDTVEMPPIREFDTAEGYYNILFHELVHSTGHASRLKRKGVTDYDKYGSQQYSEEELIAELGASFLCSICRINREDVMDNSAAYVAGWIDVLGGNPRLLMNATAFATRAVEYILGNGVEK